jgi:hypothetical protein
MLCLYELISHSVIKLGLLLFAHFNAFALMKGMNEVIKGCGCVCRDAMNRVSTEITIRVSFADAGLHPVSYKPRQVYPSEQLLMSDLFFSLCKSDNQTLRNEQPKS